MNCISKLQVIVVDQTMLNEGLVDHLLTFRNSAVLRAIHGLTYLLAYDGWARNTSSGRNRAILQKRHDNNFSVVGMKSGEMIFVNVYSQNLYLQLRKLWSLLTEIFPL